MKTVRFNFTVNEEDAEAIADLFNDKICSIHALIRKSISMNYDNIDYYNKLIEYYGKLKETVSKSSSLEEHE